MQISGMGASVERQGTSMILRYEFWNKYQLLYHHVARQQAVLLV